jgi:ABC-type sugar transport system ATPase subunit
MNLLPADGPVRAPSAPAGTLVGFRSEATRLGAADGAEGVVERVDVVGEDAYAYVRLGEHLVVGRVRAADRPALGKPERVAVDPAGIHVFDQSTGRRVGP